jgi:hypothetical protein
MMDMNNCWWRQAIAWPTLLVVGSRRVRWLVVMYLCQWCTYNVLLQNRTKDSTSTSRFWESWNSLKKKLWSQSWSQIRGEDDTTFSKSDVVSLFWWEISLLRFTRKNQKPLTKINHQKRSFHYCTCSSDCSLSLDCTRTLSLQSYLKWVEKWSEKRRKCRQQVKA